MRPPAEFECEWMAQDFPVDMLSQIVGDRLKIRTWRKRTIRLGVSPNNLAGDVCDDPVPRFADDLDVIPTMPALEKVSHRSASRGGRLSQT